MTSKQLFQARRKPAGAKWLWGVCGTLFLLAGSGCGPRLPATAPVQGIVLVGDKPLTRGSISFIPDARRGTTGRMAIALIGPDGRFSSATSFRQGDGALVGFHTIEISVPFGPTYVAEAPDEPILPQETDRAVAERLTKAGLSGLSAEVVAGKVNEFEFRVSAK